MRSNVSKRSAFTLIELLVVITIILVVMSLAMLVYLRTMLYVDDVRAIREVKLLDQGCEQFKSTFGRYPPGKIMLCETMEGYRQAIQNHICQRCYQNRQQDQQALFWLATNSIEYLQAIFPNIDLNAGHDWNGDGIIDDRQYILQGEDSLVFFLGGMRYGPGASDFAGSNRSGPMGFNTDKTNPTRKTTATRLGPFFEFEANRISYDSNTTLTVQGSSGYTVGQTDNQSPPNWAVGVSTGLYLNPGETSILFFPIYQDIWGSPYYYYAARSSQPTDNYLYYHSPFLYKLGLTTGYSFNYHRYLSDSGFQMKGIVQPGASPGPGGTGPRFDPITNTNSAVKQYYSFVPYIESYTPTGGVTYYQSRRFQIISAGKDKDLGSGGYVNMGNRELSKFENYKFIAEENIPLTNEKLANYDNISNINFERVVPRP